MSQQNIYRFVSSHYSTKHSNMKELSMPVGHEVYRAIATEIPNGVFSFAEESLFGELSLGEPTSLAGLGSTTETNDMNKHP